MFRLFIFLLLALPFSADAAEPYAKDLLPAPEAGGAEIVHHLRYPLAHKIQLELAPALFYGDKFADTKGLELDARYFLSERMAVGAGLSLFKSSVSDSLEFLTTASRPVIYEPKNLLRLSVAYYPVYGKLVFSDRVVRFRLWGEVGPQVAILDEVTEAGVMGPTSLPKSFGAFAAIGAWFALGDSFSVQLKGAYAFQSPAIYSSWRRDSTVSLGLGWRFGW